MINTTYTCWASSKKQERCKFNVYAPGICPFKDENEFCLSIPAHLDDLYDKIERLEKRIAIEKEKKC
jgi:hypothetical protein